MTKHNFPLSKDELGNNFTTGICTHVDWDPRTNVIEMSSGELWVIEAELPGVKRNDISITVEDSSQIIIRGNKKQLRRDANPRVTYYLFEREFGTFYKRIKMNFQVDEAGIESKMENGVLTVMVPRKKTEKIQSPLNKPGGTE